MSADQSDRIYPARPLVGVGAVVWDGRRVLLVRRGQPPAQGSWSLPGGLIDVGETAEAAVRREVREECGIEVEVGPVLGIFEPIVRDADQLSISAIASKVRDLAARAKQKKLRPEEMTDGTFSISNLGMFGIDEFSAVINPPEGAILGGGRVRDEPVVKDGAVVPGKKLAMTLSCDHRVVDGAIGAAFLAELRALLERPIRILTG